MFPTPSNAFSSSYGVFFPGSATVRDKKTIEEKIQKTEHHIRSLMGRLSKRKTHGGKIFRARQISLKNQIALSSHRLSMLHIAKHASSLFKDDLELRNPHLVSLLLQGVYNSYFFPRINAEIKEWENQKIEGQKTPEELRKDLKGIANRVIDLALLYMKGAKRSKHLPDLQKRIAFLGAMEKIPRFLVDKIENPFKIFTIQTEREIETWIKEISKWDKTKVEKWELLAKNLSFFEVSLFMGAFLNHFHKRICNLFSGDARQWERFSMMGRSFVQFPGEKEFESKIQQRIKNFHPKDPQEKLSAFIECLLAQYYGVQGIENEWDVSISFLQNWIKTEEASRYAKENFLKVLREKEMDRRVQEITFAILLSCLKETELDKETGREILSFLKEAAFYIKSYCPFIWYRLNNTLINGASLYRS